MLDEFFGVPEMFVPYTLLFPLAPFSGPFKFRYSHAAYCVSTSRQRLQCFNVYDLYNLNTLKAETNKIR